MSIRTFLQLPIHRQDAMLAQTATRMRIPAHSIEKDIYICYFLEKVMALPRISEHLTFKGGTSLSKAHRLTARFSEDVDLVMDRTALGLGDDAIPGPQHSPRQQKERAKKIAKACRTWTAVVLLPALREVFGQELPAGAWSLTLNADSNNHETIISFGYPRSATTGGRYLLEHVKVDLVAKADAWPHTVLPVRTYVHDLFEEQLGPAAIGVRTLEAERTLIEKVLLLHEVLVQRPDGPRSRLARHYFDLYFLHRAGVATKAMARPDLYAAVVQQRSIYYRYPGVDYGTLLQDGFNIIPLGAARDAWQEDYNGMSSDMFFGEFPDFADVLATLEQFEHEFRTHLRSTLTSTRR